MCDIRYFKAAHHHFVCAQELIKNCSWDEQFINDTAYQLQQCVEFTVKAFLECKGVTVPETHQLAKLFRMCEDNGAACIITEWIQEHAQMLTEWESQTRYNFDYYLELQTVNQAIKEIKVFLEMNGLTYTKDPSLTEAYEQALLALLPKNKRDCDTFSMNIYFHVFKKKLDNKL